MRLCNNINVDVEQVTEQPKQLSLSNTDSGDEKLADFILAYKESLGSGVRRRAEPQKARSAEAQGLKFGSNSECLLINLR